MRNGRANCSLRRRICSGANAAAMLLSDPEPDWLTAKGLGKWAQIPTSYIGYETTPVHMREALVSVGAHRISLGRRKDGAPDIDYLVSALNADRLGQPDSVTPANPARRRTA